MLLQNAQGGRSSGVVIKDDWVLTVAHAGEAPVASERIEHPELDLSLLHIKGAVGSIEFGPEPGAFDRLRAYGWHLGRNLLLTEGFQGRVIGDASTSVIDGCSGGALVNEKGQLIGILSTVVYSGTRNRDDASVVPHMAGYVPIDESVRNWIHSHINP